VCFFFFFEIGCQPTPFFAHLPWRTTFLATRFIFPLTGNNDLYLLSPQVRAVPLSRTSFYGPPFIVPLFPPLPAYRNFPGLHSPHPGFSALDPPPFLFDAVSPLSGPSPYNLLSRCPLTLSAVETAADRSLIDGLICTFDR